MLLLFLLALASAIKTNIYTLPIPKCDYTNNIPEVCTYNIMQNYNVILHLLYLIWDVVQILGINTLFLIYI